MGQPILDLASLDLTKDVVSEEELRRILPHRHEFSMLDGICHLDIPNKAAVGYKKWDADAWWGRGHIPGRPLMPGVLMIESAAQVASFLIKKTSDWEIDRFIGLAGVDNVRFRGSIEPPATIYFVSGNLRISGRRMARMPAQVVCNGSIAAEMELIGVLL
jgi:3-hydroxyacyl-[acyl-carrier-protein] dehydratase